MLGDSVTQSDSPASAGRRLRVVFVTDIVTPYMAAVFEALSRRSDLTVLFCAQSGSRAISMVSCGAIARSDPPPLPL